MTETILLIFLVLFLFYVITFMYMCVFALKVGHVLRSNYLKGEKNVSFGKNLLQIQVANLHIANKNVVSAQND